MFKLNLDTVYGDWWRLTIGRAPDEIHYRISTNDSEYSGKILRLEKLVALYECTLDECPTDEHPVRGGYRLSETEDGGIGLELDGVQLKASYSELRRELGDFLGNVFRMLDQKSTMEQREEGIEYLDAREDLRHDFISIYEYITTNN